MLAIGMAAFEKGVNILIGSRASTAWPALGQYPQTKYGAIPKEAVGLTCTGRCKTNRLARRGPMHKGSPSKGMV